MGGLTKEWFLLLIRRIFRPEYGKDCTVNLLYVTRLFFFFHLLSDLCSSNSFAYPLPLSLSLSLKFIIHTVYSPLFSHVFFFNHLNESCKSWMRVTKHTPPPCSLLTTFGYVRFAHRLALRKRERLWTDSSLLSGMSTSLSLASLPSLTVSISIFQVCSLTMRSQEHTGLVKRVWIMTLSST